MTIAKLRAARQLWARVAEVVGDARCRRGDRARGDLAADDDPARSVGEHAAHHAGRVLGRRRGRRHRAGASVRRRDPRRIPRHRSQFRAAHRPQHPAAAAGGVAHRPRARPRAAARGSSRTSPSSWPSRRGSTSRTSSPAAVSPRRRDYRRRPDRRGAPSSRSDDIAHRRTALTGVNEYPNLAEPPLPHSDPQPRCARYAAGFEALRDRSDAFLEKHRCAAAGAAAAARPARRAQHPHHVRGEPAGLRRHRGRQPGPLDADGIARRCRMPVRRSR